MRFSTDKTNPFYEVRQNLHKAINPVAQADGEIVIAKHSKPVATLLSTAGLYRYREVNRLMEQFLVLLERNEEFTESNLGLQIKNSKNKFGKINR